MPKLVNASDLLELADKWQLKFLPRDQKILDMQELWKQPIKTADSGRTVFKDNEPWTATRLTVAMLSAGQTLYRCQLPPSIKATDEEAREITSKIERLLGGHDRRTDWKMRGFARTKYVREWGYYAFVHGWTSGIDLVAGGTDWDDEEWPIYTDLWNPLEVYRDMDGDGIIRATNYTYDRLARKFGGRRPGGVPVDGYEFNISDEGINDEENIQVVSYWNSEINAVAAVYGNGNTREAAWVKKAQEHGLGFNPAFCLPMDAPPFRISASGDRGSRSVNKESNDWMAYIGQSPMSGWESAYYVMCELAEQIAANIERWAKAVVLVKTRDGTFQQFDMANPENNNVDLDTVVEVIKPNNFPVDERLWMDMVSGSMRKGSYPAAMYGDMPGSTASHTFQLYKQASHYIIDPILEQYKDRKLDSSLSILRQLEARKGSIGKKQFSAITKNGSSPEAWEWFDLRKLPKGAKVTVEIRGGGPPEDKLQQLLAVTQAANAANRPLALVTLIDEYLDRPDAPEQIKLLMWERLTTSKTVEEKAGGMLTLTELSNSIRLRGTDAANEVADMLLNMRKGLIAELEAEVKKALMIGQQPAPIVGEALAAAGAPMPPEMAAIPPNAPSGLEGEAQMAGISPIGAPIEGGIGLPQGSNPIQSALINLQDRMGGGVAPPPLVI